ncbi:hypothetical protein [Actinacidiphila acididurans]|uniref:DUF4126 domain-containing protein n=1 Tax=Actinacidiphila acididurans TaxID=2784346 RepID=A0ABS2TLI1_9ACTN|nr:hypothetical protein [Actinacidiphila acididurans]MBM9504193.1 hypothetical protein [Actinacidiphila acididurans]
MSKVLSLMARGALAGTAGTTALNSAAYVDMAVRARPSSSTPEQVVDTFAEKAGVRIPGDGTKRENRLAGLGPLVGIAVGTGVGAAVGALRATGSRLPWWAEAPLAGALAMAVADLPMVALGISDPRTWSAKDWLSDAVPHLAYGLTTTAALPSANGH